MCQNFLQLNIKKSHWIDLETKMKSSRWMHTLTLGVKQLKIILKILGWFWRQTRTESFGSHVKAVTKSAYYHLKNIAIIFFFFFCQDLEKLFHAFITSRVDYCNGLLTGFPKKTSCSSSRTLLQGFWLYHNIWPYHTSPQVLTPASSYN